MKRSLAVVLAASLGWLVVLADSLGQVPEIIGFEEDGILTFTAAGSGNAFTLEFTGDLLNGAWTSWSSVTGQAITGAVMSLPTPIFFRIKETVQPTAGTIRWTGSVFEGYDGLSWVPLTPVGFTVPLPRTGQTNSYRAGDDGDLQRGKEVSYFIVQSETNVVLDTRTGLMWTRDANLPGGPTNWNAAIDYCNDLTYGGYSDWRLPNILELSSLVKDMYYSAVFRGIQSDFVSGALADRYWSSTTCVTKTNQAWYVYLFNGYVNPGVKNTAAHYLWPVRAGR